MPGQRPVRARSARHGAALDQRQGHGESAAFCQPCTVGMGDTIVQADDGFDQGQADSKAALRPVQRTRSLREQLKYVRQCAAIDAHPVVMHGDIDSAALDRDVQSDVAAGAACISPRC